MSRRGAAKRREQGQPDPADTHGSAPADAPEEEQTAGAATEQPARADKAPSEEPANKPEPIDGADDGSLGGGPPPPPPRPRGKFRFEVAPGKAITTLRGTLDQGEEVRARYLADNDELAQASLATLVAKGYVLDNSGR